MCYAIFQLKPSPKHLLHMPLAAQQLGARARPGDSFRLLALRDWGVVFLVRHCHHANSRHGLQKIHLPHAKPGFSGKGHQIDMLRAYVFACFVHMSRQ